MKTFLPIHQFIPIHQFATAASVAAIAFWLAVPGLAEGNCVYSVAILGQQVQHVETAKPFWVMSSYSYSFRSPTICAAERLSSSSPGPPRLNAMLLAAVRTNNVRVCRKLLAQGADANAQDAQGRSALMLAVDQGDMGIVRLLLNQGAKVFLKSQSGRTALTDAVRKHDPLLVKTLIASVPSEEMLPDPASLPVMALAALMDDSSTVQELLRQEASPKGASPKDKDGTIALTMAAMYQRQEIVKILLAAGVNVNRPIRPDGSTVLMVASELPFPGESKIVEALIKAGAHIAAQDAQGKTALMHAAAGGSLETMQVLLAHGADAAVKDKKGEAAAQIAAASGNNEYQAMVALLERAVSGTQDIGKRIELVSAVEHGDVVSLQELLSGGADVTARDDAGETLLMKAAKRGQLNVVNILLKFKANAEARSLDYRHYTALARAAEAGHADVVEALLVAGADPNARIAQGYTALARATTAGCIVQIGPKMFGDPASPQHASLVAQSLLRHGADPNGIYDDGETELDHAAQLGVTPVAAVLLDHGAKVNARNAGGTALGWAVQNGWPETVDLLIARGADVNLPGEDGEKPLKVAYERGANLNAEGTMHYRRIIAALKKAGAQR